MAHFLVSCSLNLFPKDIPAFDWQSKGGYVFALNSKAKVLLERKS